MTVNKKDFEIVEELVRQAWLLSEEERKSIKPGSIESLEKILNAKELRNHCLSSISIVEAQDPVVHFLSMMRKPEFFPFTCKNLFSMDGENPFILIPFQQIALYELWNRQFPMFIASRGGGKSLLLALLICLKCLFQQGSKIIVTGAGFRQSRIIFEYVEKFWYKSPIYRDIVGHFNPTGRENGPRRGTDRFEFVAGDSVATFIPIGDGSAIRGLRSTCTIADEFQSVNPDIYEQVIQGFGAVTLDPVQNVKDAARQELLKMLGYWNQEMEDEESLINRGNQSIISGTAYYAFNHFYRYYSNYKNIINSNGDKNTLEQLFNGPIPDGFDWRDFSIVRLPYKLLPKGFMDEKTVSRAKQLNNTIIFSMEYDTIFPQDSDGFFKRGLIERCVVGRKNETVPISFPSDPNPLFYVSIRGSKDKRYVMAVDPASERDRFAITILELWPDHRRIVYCWTTKKSIFREKLKRGATTENNFYAYCGRKIRELHSLFPCVKILIDAGSGGGGNSILEVLRDKDKMEDGELPFYEVIDNEKEKDTDSMEGIHIIEMINFRDNKWVSEANHGLKKDLEDRILLFPKVDGLSMAEAMVDDEESGRLVRDEDGEIAQIYDTLEDVVLEIEELKDELATIVLTSTSSGLERWDVPGSKEQGVKKGSLRKDRYSALLMANMAARQIFLQVEPDQEREIVGGFASNIKRSEDRFKPKQLYVVKSRLKNKVNAYLGGKVVKR